MRSLLCIIFCFLSSGFYASAQRNAGRTCGTESYVETLQQQFPELKQQQQKAVQNIQKALERKKLQGQQAQMGKISIPVVFHIVYNEPGQNISDEQILSQLEVLNADFSRTNADAANTPSYFQSVAADANIEFCLAVIDPAGDPTTGITRTPTMRSAFSSFSDNVKYSSMGGVDAWDTSKYLNIWICNIENEILGYAPYPGAVTASRDGVVLLYSAVGTIPTNNTLSNYNLGRTATHEVGHWLGLKHLWGTGNGNTTCSKSDDGIYDTPTQSSPTFGCPDGIVVSCDNGPNGNMWQNYMDYSDDACMNLFTAGQVYYINAVISSARSSLLSSPACTGELRANFKTNNPEDTLISVGNSVTFFDAYEGARPTSWLWEFEGGVPATSTQQNPPPVSYNKPGKYSVKLTISDGARSSTVEKEKVNVTGNELIVYPVPASDYIIVEQPALVESRYIQLINHVGQLILSEKVEERLIRINVSHLEPGIYFLKIRSTDGLETRKIILTR